MKREEECRIKIKDFLSEVDSAESVYELFRLLNYPEKNLFDVSFKRKIEEFDFRKDERDKIKNIHTVMSFGRDLSVFLIETTSLSPSFIRYVTKVFSDRYLKVLLIFAIDYDDLVFVFPQDQKVEDGKHKLRITKLLINKNETYYTDIETLSNMFYVGEATWRDVWLKWREAFNVERATEKFFEDYQKEFFRLRGELSQAQNIPIKEAHAFVLQFLNRIMFIYFISKKRWLKNDTKFMRWFWQRYLQERSKGSSNKDSFYEMWLKPIFFEAFNDNKNQIYDRNLPDDVKKVLLKAPYLNGSLFREDMELDRLPIKIGDSLFKSVFGFFERYNFTIREDLPLDQEVAVDPQMIGYVYESLANVAEEIYDQNDLGIFYTPRVEVDFMCRRSLVEYLAKNLPVIPKSRIYEFVFDEDRGEVEKYFEEEKHWDGLEESLEGLSVVDPACGSGAFLVGMLNVLAELYKIVYKHIYTEDIRDFNLKRNIINRSLYGVEVMPWAIHAAELRLWLQLIIESNLKIEDLQKEPLLPNLDFNLRVGDSLVQEIGGINLHQRDSDIPDGLKKKLDNLKKEKEYYSYNAQISKFKDKEGIIKEEARIFEEIIKDRILNLESDVKTLEEDIKKLKKTKQMNLSGEVSESEQQKIFDVKKEKERKLEEIKKRIEELEKTKVVLEYPEKKPFIWDIDFAEIFGEKNGFDIVIGNPPYVNYQKISPPNMLKEEVTRGDKEDYKNKLITSVVTHLPVIEKINKKSDYYIYFYLHGLSLLNKRGTFCFITSNSWLDVDYGKGLQEFLLKYVPIIAVYDNQARRSFEHADVNTIIALFGAPEVEEDIFGSSMIQKKKECLGNIAKFVMFKKPFEEVLSAQNLINIENIKVEIRGGMITELAKNVVKTNDCRVFPIVQEDLLEDGWEYPEGYDPTKDENFKKGKYVGNKWGGKYLRAPDIFFTILEKGKRKLVQLGDIAHIETYFNTGGADDFFFIDILKDSGKTCIIKNRKTGDNFEIETEFLTAFIESPKELNHITISDSTLKTKLLQIPQDISLNQLKSKKIYEYLEWGVKQNFNKKSGRKNKKNWFILPKQAYEGGDVILACYMGNSHTIFYNPKNLISHRFFRLKMDEKGDTEAFVLALNSTLCYLTYELFKNPSLGGGVLAVGKPSIKSFLLISPKVLEKDIRKFNRFLNRETKSTFNELGIDPSKPIREQEPNPLSDRKELDDIIFDELGLTGGERREVYWSVCELVKNRLDKAKSLKKSRR